MSHNLQLTNLLKRLSSKVDEAKSDSDWVSIFKELKSFSKSAAIKFSHTLHWILFAVLLLSTSVFVYFYYTKWEIASTLGGWIFVIGAVVVFLLSFPIILICSNNNDISSLSDRIFQKDIFFDNGLTPVQIESGTDLWEEYLQRFGDFARGDEDRKITSLVKGHYKGTEHSFDFEYYVFEYVIVTYVFVPNGKGGGHTQRVTTTYHRYGVQIPFPFATRVAVVGNGGSYEYNHTWKTPSIEFNDHFNVYTDDEMTIAKFLQPSVVTAFLKTASHFSELNVEVSADNIMCISFENDSVIKLKREHGIENPEQFEEEIRKNLDLPELQAVNEFAHELMRFND